MRRLIRVIDEHWFGPLSGSYLSFARVVIFGGLLFFLLAPFPFGEPAELARQHALTRTDGILYQPLPALKVLLLPFGEWGTVRPSAEFLRAIWFVAVATAAASVLGIGARLSMIACAATTTLLYAHGYAYHELHHPDAALVIAIWVLALGPIAGSGWWRRFSARVREPVHTRELLAHGREAERLPIIRWPLRLIQWVMVLVYLSAGISKLINGGLDWLNGHTLSYFLVQDSFHWFDGGGPGMWLSQYPSITAVLSAVTLAFELTFVLAVLFPRFAWVYVFIGTVLHLGIYIVQRATFFHYIVLYVVFAEAIHHTLKAAPAKTRRLYEAMRSLRRREAHQPAT